MSYIILSNNQLIALAITVLVVLAFLMAIKSQLQNTSSEQNLMSELAKKDNFAVGISYAASIFSVILVIGFIAKEFNLTDWQNSLPQLIIALMLAIIFIWLGKWVHNKLILRNFNEAKAIEKRNLCAALVDSGVLIANSVIVLGLYKWSEATNFNTLLIDIIGFIVIQVIILIHTRWQEQRFATTNQGASLQRYFVYDNTSIGLRFAAEMIALSLAIYAALSSIKFIDGNFIDNVITIMVNVAIFVSLHQIIAFLVLKIALPKVIKEIEVDQQDNIGIASIELAVHLAIGILLIFLFSS
jgi:hypothetical protein